MSILVDQNTRLLVQGITGKEGSYHAGRCREYGTNLVAGVTPGKGGQMFDGDVPVFDTVEQAVDETGANASLIFVPPPFAADAIVESVDAGIPVIATITEGVPVKDSVKVVRYLQGKDVMAIGPNCPGVISPGAKCKMGIMPGYIHSPGRVGIVSRSGTLTYEAVGQLSVLGIGQSTSVGIGGECGAACGSIFPHHPLAALRSRAPTLPCQHIPDPIVFFQFWGHCIRVRVADPQRTG